MMKIVHYKFKDSGGVSSFFREIFKELGWEERPTDHMTKPHLLFPFTGAWITSSSKRKR